MSYVRTPEHEAARIAGLQRALKGKPATAKQKAARYKGLLKAWREGRVKAPVLSKAARQSIADQLRGKPRPRSVIEKIAKANRGKRRTKAMREAMSRRQKERIARLGPNPKCLAAFQRYRESPEFLEHQRELFSNPERERRRLAVLRGIKWDAEMIEKRVKPMRGRAQIKPLTAKGPQHHKSMVGAVRSPTNVVHQFKNLNHFVRTHEDLFAPDDVIWISYNKKKPGQVACRASKGLGRLFGKCGNVPNTWKGWVKLSHYERLRFGKQDLLDRGIAE